MSNLLKSIVTLIVVIIILVFVYYFYSVQNTNTLTVIEESKTELAKDNIAVGHLRSEINEQGHFNEEELNKFNKDELIANLVSDLASEYKDVPHDINVNYVFYDENNVVTKVEEEMNSMLFWIEYIDENDQLKTSPKKKIAIEKLINFKK